MSSQQSTPFSYFTGNNTFGIEGKNIWSSNNDEKYVGSGTLKEDNEVILYSQNGDKFM